MALTAPVFPALCPPPRPAPRHSTSIPAPRRLRGVAVALPGATVAVSRVRRRSAEAEWVPKKEVLEELAASERPIGYYCLREPGSNTCDTICEVRRPSSSDLERRFQLKISGAVRHFVVQELPFSEGKLGGHLWDGGILMSAWCANHSELFEDPGPVLELGSGIGLLGLTLSCRVPWMILSDFGGDDAAGLAPEESQRLVPQRLLENLRQNVALNGIANAEVRHIDWYDYLAPGALRAERFQRLVAADVVYYSSDVPALAATIGAHLCPLGEAYILVVRRAWKGPEAQLRATAEDLAEALKIYGQVTISELLGYCCTFEEVPLALIKLIRADGPA